METSIYNTSQELCWESKHYKNFTEIPKLADKGRFNMSSGNTYKIYTSNTKNEYAYLNMTLGT